ncbi:terminase [Labrys sp. WJW]|uniref:phage terminase large subunit family protein n=1 Tax=Labrys sp. WJW TaxID=1737983 RepID=UPI00082B9DBF|nr:terminase gpA endonuclease subunit [Labrys sp. WJW]OCC06372.1 terminase [Labrys sp. WJW]
MRSEALQRVRTAALRNLIPPPKIDLPTWVEENIRLPDSVAALPGPLKLTKPQRGVLEAMGDPDIERLTWVKPVRIGASTALTAFVGAHVHNEPAPIMVLLPTEDDCRRYVTSDVEPIFQASPTLRGSLTGELVEGRNTLLSRRFPGGSLKIVAAKAPRNLRAHNVRILLVDECDGMENTTEGSPILLAEKRTLSFANRKIVLASTPTYEESGHILRAYRESDQRVFELQCPHCSGRFEALWRHVRWPEGEPEKAFMVCDSGCVIEESEKPAMVENGRWRATRPEVKGHAGFKCNALISNLHNARWSVLVKEFLAAKRGGPDQLQTWTNTILAEGWKNAVEEVSETELASRAGNFGLTDIPAEVLVVTAGVDVQRDRLEVSFIGHGKDNTVFVLGHNVIWGSPADDSTWAELDELLRTTWPHKKGGTLRVDAAAVDAGDGVTMDRVLAFCHPRWSRKIVPIKGVAGTRPAIEVSKTRGSRLWILGVDGVKQNVIRRLAGGQGIQFSNTLPARWYEEVTSERLVVRYQRGFPIRQWERIPGRAAECLDCLTYAVAVRGIVGQNLERREQDLSSAGHPAPRQPMVIRSRWMSR